MTSSTAGAAVLDPAADDAASAAMAAPADPLRMAATAHETIYLAFMNSSPRSRPHDGARARWESVRSSARTLNTVHVKWKIATHPQTQRDHRTAA